MRYFDFDSAKRWERLRDFWHPSEWTIRENGKNCFFVVKCKSVVIESAGKAVLKEVDVPETRPGEVLIEVAYVGVCSTDLEILDGTLGYYRFGRADYPITPGHEFSGVIAKVGTNVTHVKKGDPVVAECIQSCSDCHHCRAGNPMACAHRKELGVFGKNGAYSEYISVPVRFVHRPRKGRKTTT